MRGSVRHSRHSFISKGDADFIWLFLCNNATKTERVHQLAARYGELRSFLSVGPSLCVDVNTQRRKIELKGYKTRQDNSVNANYTRE